MEWSRGKLPRHSASASIPLGDGALYRVDWGLSASFMFAPMDDNVIHDNRRSSHGICIVFNPRARKASKPVVFFEKAPLSAVA